MWRRQKEGSVCLSVDKKDPGLGFRAGKGCGFWLSFNQSLGDTVVGVCACTNLALQPTYVSEEAAIGRYRIKLNSN